MGTIIRSLLMIIAAAAIVGGVTKANFSDSKTINNNTLTNGTVKISLSNPAGTLPFTETNWAPGQTRTIQLKVTNTGSLEAKLKAAVAGKWDHTGTDGHVNITSLKYSTDNGATWHSVSSTDDIVLAASNNIQVEAGVTLDKYTDNTYQGRTYRASFSVTAEYPGGIE